MLTSNELERALVRALRNTVFLVAGLYLLFRLLAAVTFLVLFFTLVFLLAAALNPLVAWLERYRLRRPVGAAALGLFLIGSVGAGAWYGVPPLVDQGRRLAEDAPELWDGLRARGQRSLARRPELAAQIPTSKELLRRLQPYAASLAGELGRVTVSAFSVLFFALLLIVLVVFSLATPQPLIVGLLGAVPERHRPTATRILELVFTRLKAWAIGSLVLGGIVGVITTIGLYFLGVPFALVFGLLAAVGEVLPNLGPLLSAIPPILVSLAIDPKLALWVALLFIVVQQLENFLVVPLVMSRSLNLQPLSVSFVVLVMGALFGFVGALIAVPVAVIVKTIYEEVYLLKQGSHNLAALEVESERVVSAVEATDGGPVS